MKINQWTLGLAAVGVVSLASAVNAEEQKMNALQTALSSTTISGYVDTSIEWTPSRVDKSGAGFDSWPSSIPFREFGGYYGDNDGANSKSDGFNLNVVKLSIEKPMDESEWASGYKVDLLFGPDAVNYNSSVNGAENNGNTGRDNDFAIKQAYVALRTPLGNGIDWKIGTWDTIIGYETFEAGNNPNFTRSWGYAIEPTQHTGILGTYRINDNISVAAGVANTLMAGINARNTEQSTGADPTKGYWHKTFMGSVAITAPSDCGFLSGSTLYAGVVSGFAGGTEDQHNYYVGATLNTPVAGLKAGIAFDYVDNLGGGDGIGGDFENDVWVAGLYASYQATEKLSLHARAEYGDLKFSDTSIGSTDKGHEYMTSLTGTIQYDLWKNVISRLEIRWDQMHTKSTFDDGETVTQYDYVDATQVGLYANFIYKF